MNSDVKVVAHPETGAVITQNVNKPEFGTLRLDSENVSMSGGYLNKNRRTAFVGGNYEEFKSLGLRAGQVMPGLIQKQESFSPFYEGQSPKINPTTQEVIFKNGKEVYLQFEYIADSNAADSIWIDETPAEVDEATQTALAAQATGEPANK